MRNRHRRDIASASQDGKLLIWNGHDAIKIHSASLRSSWVMTCGFEQARRELVACGGLDNLCSIYKINIEMRLSSELAGHDGYVSCCRFVDESQILTVSGDSTCILWDVERNKLLRQFTDHTGDVMSLSLNPDSHDQFVTGSCDSTAKLWDARVPADPPITFAGHDADINSVAFFPDGRAFGAGSDDSTCQLFDLRCLVCLNKFKSEAVSCGIASVEFSRSGRILFAGYHDCNAYCWDILKDGLNFPRVWTLSDHNNRVSCVGVCSTGEAVCTGSWDALLKIWN